MFREKTNPYIEATELRTICARLGRQISSDYQDKDLILVCILKGSIVFFSDLIREITIPVNIDFVRLSSYGHSTESSGVVRVIKDLSLDIREKNVLIVEDILDTGNTLNFLINHLKSSKPSSVKICTMLDKPSRRRVEVRADYCGRVIDDVFVVGYGLDYQEKCRNYPDIRFVPL